MATRTTEMKSDPAQRAAVRFGREIASGIIHDNLAKIIREEYADYIAKLEAVAEAAKRPGSMTTSEEASRSVSLTASREDWLRLLAFVKSADFGCSLSLGAFWDTFHSLEDQLTRGEGALEDSLRDEEKENDCDTR